MGAPYAWPKDQDFFGGVVYRFLSDGENQEQDLANISMVGDYSSEEKIFCIYPEDNECIAIYRIMVSIRDSGRFDSGSYGNGVVLTNGIKLEIRTNGFSTPIVPLPIKVNPDWARYCYDTELSDYGSGVETLNARWTFVKAGSPLWLAGADVSPTGLAYRFCAVLNDDFSDLVEHTILCQGLKWDTTKYRS